VVSLIVYFAGIATGIILAMPTAADRTRAAGQQVRTSSARVVVHGSPRAVVARGDSGRQTDR